MRQHYRQVMHVAKADVAVAIYTGVPSGSPSPGLSMTLVYIGLNAPAGLKDKGNAVDLVGGTVSHMTSVRATALPVGPGDTTNECATGVEQGRRALVCGWSSDRCFGLLLQTSPDATISELAAAMRNMRPDLVRS